jgi:hypothetical protein
MRPTILATVIALSIALFAPSLVAAAPEARASLTGDTLTVRVLGGERAAAWRVRIVAPGGQERVDIVLRPGDVAWSAVVRTSEWTSAGWSVVSRERIGGTFSGLDAAGGRSAGVAWHTSDFRLPQDGDGRFVVRVELLRDGTYRAASHVREAEEAFTYGPWQRVGSELVSH